MHIKSFFKALFLSCFLFLMGYAQAYAVSPLFTVKDVTVDITADSAADARKQAFDEAQKKAFDVLTGRMLSDDEIIFEDGIDISMIAPLIKDFEITQEQLSSVRYIGTYTFRFDKDNVSRFFSDQGYDYTDVSSRPVLALPFYKVGDQTVLWSSKNPWMNVWRNAENLQGLVPVTVPLGDMSDIQAIGDGQAFEYDEKKLFKMLERYDAGEAVLLLAVPDGDLAMHGSDGDMASGRLNVYIYRTDRGQPQFVQRLIVEAKEQQARADFFDQALRKTFRSLQRDWKRKTVTNAAEANKLQVRVKFSGLEQWTQTQAALSRVYGVEQIDVQSIKPGEAMVDILFQGTEQRLRLALQQADMTLTTPKISLSGFSNASFWGGKQESSPLIYDLFMNKYGYN